MKNSSRFIKLLQTTLIKEVKMSFGYFCFMIILVMLLTMLAGFIGVILV